MRITLLLIILLFLLHLDYLCAFIAKGMAFFGQLTINLMNGLNLFLFELVQMLSFFFLGRFEVAIPCFLKIFQLIVVR